MTRSLTAALLALAVMSLFPLAAHSITPQEVRQAVKQSGGPESFVRLLLQNMVKNPPIQLDTITVFLSGYATGKTAFLDHQIIQVETKSSWHQSDAEMFIRYQTNKVCSGDVLSVLIREYDASVFYRYFAKNGERLFAFEVKKSDCNKVGKRQ